MKVVGMKAVGWVMESIDGIPVVIAATDKSDFLIRDTKFAHGRTWFMWRSGDIVRDSEWVTEEYEIGNYTLAVPPTQVILPDMHFFNPADREAENEIEKAMHDLLVVLVSKLPYKLPVIMSRNGVPFKPWSHHTLTDHQDEYPSPADTIASWWKNHRARP